MSYSLVPLIDRTDLNEDCIKLLNEEWPRSYTSRAHSQTKSCRPTPPMSLLLISSSQLIGHSRICLLPDRDDACWVESVIVSKSQRGKGLGKLLMGLTEEKAVQLGFSKVYLSTHDQIHFYTSCGYSRCSPILHSTTSTSVFPVISRLLPSPPPPISSSSTPPSSSSSSPNFSNIPPPPPPPPLRPSTEFDPNDESNQHYMCKTLT